MPAAGGRVLWASRRDRVGELWRAGISTEAIAARLGVSRDYVSDTVRRLGLERRRRGRPPAV